MSAKITDITRSGCLISVHVKVGGPGTYELKVWDDGTVISDESYVLAQDASAVLPFRITRPALTAAPGIGFTLQIYKDGRQLDSVDPYLYPDWVAANCAASGGMTDQTPAATPGPTPGLTLAATGLDLTGKAWWPAAC